MPIPAVAPPPAPPQRGYEPGTVFSPVVAVLDDAAGSGVVIPFGQADADRVGWRLTGDLDGWDSADLPETATNKVGADGMWGPPNYYTGRQVTIEGLIEAPSAAVLDAAMAKLDQALPPRGRTVTLTVYETTPKLVTGRRSGRLQMSKVTDTLAQFNAVILATDPRKYGLDVMTAAASLGVPGGGSPIPIPVPLVLPGREPGGEFFTASNPGAYETPPLIRIVGPGRRLGIANLTTNQSLSYPFELGAADELVIDPLVGGATLNGTTYRSPASGSSVTSRFLLPPGESRLQFLGSRTQADVTPLLTMTWRPAWT